MGWVCRYVPDCAAFKNEGSTKTPDKVNLELRTGTSGRQKLPVGSLWFAWVRLGSLGAALSFFLGCLRTATKRRMPAAGTLSRTR